jgi:multiple sugar transport system ATP-binding protein
MPELALDNVTKVYPPNSIGVHHLTLQVPDGALLALVGPSGCGKTTMLRLIAGLDEPTEGTISIGGTVVNGQPPGKRDLGMVFQRPALYPHRNVRDNLAFSLKLRHATNWWPFSSKSRQQAIAISNLVSTTAKLLGLENVLDRYPAQLSGGQQQRVALGRALVRQPGVLLLDEPLSSLDAVLRHELRRELHLLQRELHATMVYVTHDPVEALSLGDCVAVLERGHLHQVDRGEVLLQYPADRFVAGFVGWPPMNFLNGEIQAVDGELFFVGAAGRLPIPASRIEAWSCAARRPLTLGIRPQDVRLVDKNALYAIPMSVRLVELLNHGALVTLTSHDEELMAWLTEDCQMHMLVDIMPKGSNAMVHLQLENGYLFDRESGAAVGARPTG